MSEGNSQRNINQINRLNELVLDSEDRNESPHHSLLDSQGVVPQERAALQRTRDELVNVLWTVDWPSWAPGINSYPSPNHFLKDCERPVAASVLDSLSFSTMLARRKAITKAHIETFKWVFKNNHEGEESSKSENFRRWLRETTGSLYWITGKPGSGKSTLTKYIFESSKLRSYLKAYAGDLPLLLMGYFFWHPGSTMQKSEEGLLRTLLYQCLEQRTELIPFVTPRRWALYNITGNSPPAPNWTIQELKESFEVLCSYHNKEFRLVVFLDGLDEVAGAESESRRLAEWIINIVKEYRIKFCVSSRPWVLLSDIFGNYPSLAMQDLTKRDMARFVQNKLGESMAFRDLAKVYPEGADEIRNKIIKRAEGVFLWVSLVVHSLLQAVPRNLSPTLLLEELDQIPSDVMGLYDSIWARIPPESLECASKILQLYRAQYKSTTTKTFWLALWGHERKSAQKLARVDIDKLLEWVLEGHTLGICRLASGRVGLLHRSALDWMAGEENWASICRKAPASFDPKLEYLEAFLSLAPTEPQNRQDFFRFVCSSFCHLSAMQRSSRADDARKVQAVDDVNKAINRMFRTGCEKGEYNNVLATEGGDKGLESFSGACWPNLVLGDNVTHIEFSFVGIAASAGFVSYVKTKVEADRSLLTPKLGRVSLLENTIFPQLWTVWDSEDSGADFLPKIKKTSAQRLEIIEFLLRTSNTQYKTALDYSMHDAVYKAQRLRNRWRLDQRQWYAQVLGLLEKYGYREDDAPDDGIKLKEFFGDAAEADGPEEDSEIEGPGNSDDEEEGEMSEDESVSELSEESDRSTQPEQPQKEEQSMRPRRWIRRRFRKLRVLFFRKFRA